MNAETELSKDVVNAIRSGRTIEAIKLLREERGLGLKEAKELVDAYDEKHPSAAADEVVQRQSGGGAGVFVVIVVLITAAYAAYYYLV